MGEVRGWVTGKFVSGNWVSGYWGFGVVDVRCEDTYSKSEHLEQGYYLYEHFQFPVTSFLLPMLATPLRYV